MMRSNYKKIGDFIRLVDERNKELKATTLLGLTINKEFIPSVANTIGTNMANYKIIRKNQFACSLMQVRRDKKIPVALLKDFDEAIISQAYPVFEIVDTEKLLPDYLMMWFSRSEFDREACFYAVGGVRGSLEWEDFLEMKLPVPSIKRQKEIVAEYNAVVTRIKLNERLNKKLEETAQTIYKRWFVDFEFPNEEGKPYKSSGGKMVWNEELEKEIPEGWRVGKLCEIANVTMGQSPSGSSYNSSNNGIIFYQGRTEFNFRFPTIKKYTSEPKRYANKNDILMSVRAPVGDINIAFQKCCIGRGIASISPVDKNYSFLFYLIKDVKNIFNISNAEGTIFGSISKDELNGLKILIPYKYISTNFNIKVNKIDNRIKIQCSQINEFMNLKETLLSKMAKG